MLISGSVCVVDQLQLDFQETSRCKNVKYNILSANVFCSSVASINRDDYLQLSLTASEYNLSVRSPGTLTLFVNCSSGHSQVTPVSLASRPKVAVTNTLLAIGVSLARLLTMNNVT